VQATVFVKLLVADVSALHWDCCVSIFFIDLKMHAARNDAVFLDVPVQGTLRHRVCAWHCIGKGEWIGWRWLCQPVVSGLHTPLKIEKSMALYAYKMD
jgi:hypothetical protein